jgi:hypothetical protein
MKIYIYYNKFDSTREPIGKIKAKSVEQAVNLISQIKQLSKDDFLNVFEIQETQNK